MASIPGQCTRMLHHSWYSCSKWWKRQRWQP